MTAMLAKAFADMDAEVECFDCYERAQDRQGRHAGVRVLLRRMPSSEARQGEAHTRQMHPAGHGDTEHAQDIRGLPAGEEARIWQNI